MAAAAVSANAQYVVADAGIQPVLDKGDKAEVFHAFLLDGQTIADLEKAGKTVYNYLSTDLDGVRPVYIWDETFISGDGTAPGADFQTEGHMAFTVGTVGWSGGGMYQKNEEGGMDLSGISDQTRVHIAYSAAANPVKSIGFKVLQEDSHKDPAYTDGVPACFAVGAAGSTVDNLPTVGAGPTDEWQAVDMSFADLKKIDPAFKYNAVKGWYGNYIVFLGGGVPGQNLELDAIYFYSPKSESGISNIEMGKAEIVVTGKTVNASGAKHMALYDLTGKTVKAVEGSVLGLNGVPAGLYLVKADNTVVKVLVK